MKKLTCLSTFLILLSSSRASSFLPTVSPSSLKGAQGGDDTIVILNRISLFNGDRENESFDVTEDEGIYDTTPLPSRRKKYLKKIVVRRRPKERVGFHEKGYKMIGPMEYAKEDANFARQTTPSLLRTTVARASPRTIPYLPQKSNSGFKKTKDFMSSVKIINGIKLKKWKTKKPLQKQESIYEGKTQRSNDFLEEKERDSSLYYGDKVSGVEYEDSLENNEAYRDEDSLESEAYRDEDFENDINVDYLSKADVEQIQLLRETYFSTTEKNSDVTDVDIYNLGYTPAPKPLELKSTPPPLQSTKSTTTSRNELLRTTTDRPGITTTPNPVFDRSHLPKAFEFVPEVYLSNLTAQDILFGDPLTHTHPLGTHPLLPVHKGFDVPHSHPPYEDEPILRLLPKLSTLMKSFLFPEESSLSERDSLRNPKRQADPKITYSYERNESHFSHEVKMPGHHQFHSQGLANKKLKKILIKARKTEETRSEETQEEPQSTSPFLTAASSTLQYSPIIPREFVSSLEPRTGTSAKIDYARRKRAFKDLSPSDPPLYPRKS